MKNKRKGSSYLESDTRERSRKKYNKKCKSEKRFNEKRKAEREQ